VHIALSAEVQVMSMTSLCGAGIPGPRGPRGQTGGTGATGPTGPTGPASFPSPASYATIFIPPNRIAGVFALPFNAGTFTGGISTNAFNQIIIGTPGTYVVSVNFTAIPEDGSSGAVAITAQQNGSSQYIVYQTMAAATLVTYAWTRLVVTTASNEVLRFIINFTTNNMLLQYGYINIFRIT
jgi:hypothetical protein